MYNIYSHSLLIAKLTLDESQVFNYVGKYSNIIEKTRATEIALSIQQQKDLGCQAVQVITINDDKLTCSRNQVEKFWNYLGVSDCEKLNSMFFFLFSQYATLFRYYMCTISIAYYIIAVGIEAGHPDEDELYESAIIDTNMVYELKDEQLVSHEKFWGTLPEIEMLDKNKVIGNFSDRNIRIYNMNNIYNLTYHIGRTFDLY